MPRIIVVADDQETTMDETVIPEHLNDEHSAVQLLERLAWAIEDADARVDSPQRADLQIVTPYRQVSAG